MDDFEKLLGGERVWACLKQPMEAWIFRLRLQDLTGTYHLPSTNNTRSIENVNGGEFTHSTYSPKQIVMEFSYFKTLRQGNSVRFRRKMSEILYSKRTKETDFFLTNQAFTMKQSWMGNRYWERMICTAPARSHG